MLSWLSQQEEKNQTAREYFIVLDGPALRYGLEDPTWPYVLCCPAHLLNPVTPGTQALLFSRARCHGVKQKRSLPSLDRCTSVKVPSPADERRLLPNGRGPWQVALASQSARCYSRVTFSAEWFALYKACFHHRNKSENPYTTVSN